MIIDDSMSSYLKIAKIFELMNEGSDESLNEIKRIARDDFCPIVRHEAVFALGEMAAPEIISFLKDLIIHDENYVVRHEALIAIGTLGSKDDIDFLKKYTTHQMEEISSSAKIGIERINQVDFSKDSFNERKDEYIEELLDFSTPLNRKIQILFQLMLIADKDSVSAIYDSLRNDMDSVVRHEAGFVLGEIGTEKCVELMGRALEYEDSPIVIHETLFGLGTSGKKEALVHIEKFLDHSDYVVSESAKIARERLLKIKNPYSGARHFAG